ncbi:hypothetical protein G9A89_012881 [Geosiphon pyriformis]|nr:hypothetical protein G9A89_012881 [Geosiphon pyriformis]
MGLYLIQHQKLSFRTSTNKHHSKVAESENIEANHLEFAKSLFQHYCQHLELNHNHISTKSAFNFYVNKKISSLLETPVNTESARETFYRKLIQNTNLPTNHNFASIITEINKEIEHHIQQRYPITYASKGKRKLQTPVKTRVESPTAPSYHYTPRSAINIISASTSTSNMISTFRQFLFQSKQRKTDLLGPYGKYFEGFKNYLKKKRKKNWKIKNLLTKTQSLKTRNLELRTFKLTPQNQNPEVINQHLSPPIQIPNQQNQQPSPVPSQQQQLPPQQQQQITYAPIAKLDKFTGEEDDAQPLQPIDEIMPEPCKPYLIFSRIQQIHDIKVCNNNSINKLANTFTTIKQGETEAVTTYLGCFHRNLRQIQAIDANYFTAPQILNQFICSLCSSILQHVHLLHPATLQDAVTHARDFKSAELEANYVYAMNLVMNRSSELDSKLKQFSDSINQNCGSQKRVFVTTVISNSESLPKLRSNYLPTNDIVTNLSTTSISNSSPSNTHKLSTTATSNLSVATSSNLSTPTTNSNTATKLASKRIPKTENHAAKLEIIDGRSRQWNLGAGHPQNPNSQDYLSLLVTLEDTSPSNQEPTQKQQTLTSNILPATVTNDKSLAAIFLFKIKEPSSISLFSGAAFDEKPITMMYTDAKVNGQSIKLILDSSSAGSIITQQLMDQLGHRVDRTASTRIITADGVTKTPIGEIDDFSFKINGIITLIKVLVMKATQYQALVGNDWLFKTPPKEKLLIELEEEKEKSTWKAYQVFWADANHNKLLLILLWNDNPKGKQKEELTWKTDDLIWTDNEQEEPLSWKWKEEKGKEKEREEENTQANNTYIPYTYSQQQSLIYRQPKLICINCSKKLSSIGACCVGKWDNTPCLACGETLLNEGMWNDISERGGMCNVSCQYTILISDWVEKGTPIKATWRRAVQQLDSCPHNDDELWQMAITKIESALPEEIKTIKNNLSEPIELNWDAKPVINFLEPEEFYEHYQNLTPTKEEQEQQLAQLNTRLCHYCLILSNFEYCDDCNLIYNLPPCMIYMIHEEEEPISSCASESESPINHDSNSDNNDDNNSSSFIQNSNNNNNDSNSDSNSNTKYKQYIALPDLSKEQELKWYSNNGEGIMPERMHNTDAEFDLKYPEKEAIKLEPHLCTCIDLKIALEILATTIVQLASRSSLVKRGIIDMGYIRNIITMLQNDSEKAYIIEPNKKIAQTIFLPLVRIAQLILVGKKEKLGITARGIQGFGSTNRINVPVNMVEEKIVGQGEIISTGQAISISPYSQYILTIERKEKEQEQIFEAEANFCESEEIGLSNLHIPAKSYSHIKIPIYNNTGNVINISEKTTIRYLTTEIEDQPPNSIPDFPQLCGYVDITLQIIYGQSKCYLFQPEQLEQMNMENLNPL